MLHCHSWVPRPTSCAARSARLGTTRPARSGCWRASPRPRPTAATRGARPEGQPHTPWRLIEHLRIAQWDILEFSRYAEHGSPAWPEGYWPETDGPPDASAWDRSIEAFRADLAAMRGLVSDPANDLTAELPWGDGQTLLREALLVADHNAYHLGQLVTLRQLLGGWPPGGTAGSAPE